jgi:hypothetical protein
MTAYEFYWIDPIKGYQLIGRLPERRKNPSRITPASIMNWGEKFFGKKLEIKDIFFIQVTIEENTGRIFRPTEFFIHLRRRPRALPVDECVKGS